MLICLYDFLLFRMKYEISDNYISSRLHGLFYGALLCALFGITPSLYMGTVMRDGNISGIPIYFLTYHYVHQGNHNCTGALEK